MVVGIVYLVLWFLFVIFSIAMIRAIIKQKAIGVKKMLKDDDYNVFKRWAEAEGYNLDDPNLSWGIVQSWIIKYENAKNRDTWNYRTALHKERMGQN